MVRNQLSAEWVKAPSETGAFVVKHGPNKQNDSISVSSGAHRSSNFPLTKIHYFRPLTVHDYVRTYVRTYADWIADWRRDRFRSYGFSISGENALLARLYFGWSRVCAYLMRSKEHNGMKVRLPHGSESHNFLIQLRDTDRARFNRETCNKFNHERKIHGVFHCESQKLWLREKIYVKVLFLKRPSTTKALNFHSETLKWKKRKSARAFLRGTRCSTFIEFLTRIVNWPFLTTFGYIMLI